MRFRRLHHWYANMAGYFWVPCPICGEVFGGHEWRDIDGIPSTIRDEANPSLGQAICPTCTAAGRGDRGLASMDVPPPVPAPHPMDAAHPPQDFDG